MDGFSMDYRSRNGRPSNDNNHDLHMRAAAGTGAKVPAPFITTLADHPPSHLSTLILDPVNDDRIGVSRETWLRGNVQRPYIPA